MLIFKNASAELPRSFCEIWFSMVFSFRGKNLVSAELPRSFHGVAQSRVLLPRRVRNHSEMSDPY